MSQTVLPKPEVSDLSPERAKRGFLSREGHGLLIVPAFLFTVFGIGYTLVLSTWYAFTRVEQGQHGFAWLFTTPVYLDIIQRTFVTAIITVLACLLLGYPFAYLITISSKRMQVLLIALALIPFWISGLVRIFAWVIILQPGGLLATYLPFVGNDGLLRTELGVQIGLVQVLLPFMILPLFSVMRTIDLRLMMAAESLGARRSVAFFRVFVPLSLPGVFAGTLIVLVLTLGFYVLPQMLGSPQQALIGQAIYTQASTLGNLGRASAISVTLLVSTLAIIMAGIILRKLTVRGGAR